MKSGGRSRRERFAAAALLGLFALAAGAAKAKRVFAAMMDMGKIDTAKIEVAGCGVMEKMGLSGNNPNGIASSSPRLPSVRGYLG